MTRWTTSWETEVSEVALLRRERDEAVLALEVAKAGETRLCKEVALAWTKTNTAERERDEARALLTEKLAQANVLANADNATLAKLHRESHEMKVLLGRLLTACTSRTWDPTNSSRHDKLIATVTDVLAEIEGECDAYRAWRSR